MKKLLFVCTGNTCRSPMAEAIFNNLGIPGFTAMSAGLMAHEGDELSYNAGYALYEIGIIGFKHKAINVTEQLIRECDYIFGITQSHTDALLMKFPKYRVKINDFPSDVADPFGNDLNQYRIARDDIIRGIDILEQRIDLGR